MNRNSLLITAALILVLGIGIYAMSRTAKTPAPHSPAKLQIVASFYPMAFFAQQIAGDKADVINITPAGAEPHEYEPSTQDIVKMEQANLIILNGNVEPWGDSIQANLQNNSVHIITAGEGLGSADPHVWLDPILAKQEVQKISDAITAIDPSDSSFYAANTVALLQKFDQLDTAYKNGLAICSSRDIVTSHAAFGYLAERYGLNQLAIAGLSPDEEPATKALIDTAKFVQGHNVKYIFFESLVSPKLSQTIANETGAQTLELNPLEGLTQTEIGQGQDYFSVMYNNLYNLQLALSCTK